MKTKEKVIIAVGAIIIASLSYWFFWQGFYSVDTYRITSQGYTEYALSDAYIRDGRLFSALIISLLGLINPSYKLCYIINLIIAMIISGITVLKLYEIINYFKKPKNAKFKILYFLVSFTFIFNFTVTDIFQFIYSFAIVSSILFYLLALKKSIIEKKYKISFVYALLGLIWYQGTITMYIATAFLMCLLESKKLKKEFFKRILPPAIIIILATIINVIMVALVPVVTNLEATPRIGGVTRTINVITRNLQQFDKIFKDCFGYFPKYLLIIFILTTFSTLLIYAIKNKKLEKAITAFILIYVYISVVFLIFPIQSIELCIRIIISIGECVSALFIYMICNTEIFENTKIYRNILSIILCIYFIVTIYNNIKVTKEFILANELDQKFATTIGTEVEKLRAEGKEVKYYSVYYTLNGKRLSEMYNSEITFYNSSYLMSRDFYKTFIIFWGNDLNLEKVMADPEIVEENFDNPSDEEIQIKYINDILYVIVDL